MALRYGVDPRAMSTLPGLDPETLDNDLIRVPNHTMWSICELITLTGIAEAGVAAGASIAPGALDSWGYLFATGDSLADGLRAAAHYSPAVTDPTAAFEVVEDGRLLTVRYRGIEAVPRLSFLHEWVMGMLLRRVQDATSTAATPIRVSFAHAAPRSHRYLTHAFATANIEFDAAASEITFIDPEAGTPPTPRDPELDRIVTRYTEMMMTSAKAPPDWHSTFLQVVSDALARDEVSLDAIANRLCMSTRTLQRRFEEQGTSWRDEVEAVRHEKTLRLLGETDLTVESVASRVGYADARTLRKAFLRWTGQTPDAYRRASRV
ncbi:AraC family transcriptional regulator ligand-binding domain-containing protein [Actinospica durhamensis]|uniref:AraC family transcriptional regulator ligand-binding domain-containing protein n=1 Tax=Actinospica durhamensis TaxID=1508375 RepID=A0A941EYA6_9ACTN|nr:AraC family transcriptional regulator [Actinospica durhamensis]MBR7838698.1 AraC family transcriptional regulator ligand-binding domain-containing protein [Actinospica durhamensis]